MPDERNIRLEDVWEEHRSNVHINAHWAYLFAVIFGGLIVMLAFIALLGASG